MRPIAIQRVQLTNDPDWDFFLPDDEFAPDETFPEPGDFWIEPDYDQ